MTLRLRVLSGLLAAIVLLSHLEIFYLTGLLAHFRMQMLVVALLWLTLVAACKEKVALAITSATVLILLASVVPFLISKPAQVEGHSVELVSANILGSNKNYQAIRDAVRQWNADVLVMLEVRPHVVPTLKELDYPHQEILPLAHNFGLAVLSRIPILKSENFSVEEGFPTLMVELDGGLTVVATHPLPPVNRPSQQVGDATLNQILEKIGWKKKVVVAGDLNATPWSRRGRMLENSGMLNACRGYSLSPTWPVGQPIFYIPIDHIYRSLDLGVESFEVLPSIGSDHFPIRARLTVPR